MAVIGRRGVLAGLAAAAPAAIWSAPAWSADRAQRRFAILRDGSDIGWHATDLRRAGGDLQLAVDVEIQVKILGVTVYRYEMTNREIWRDGALISGDSTINDDGEAKRVKISRDGGGLVVDSSFGAGAAPGDAATTVYFTPDFIGRSDWISTDSGEVYAMRYGERGEAQVATATGSTPCRVVNATNGSDFDVDLSYDQRGEWASVSFDAQGEKAVYVADNLDGDFASLWRGA